MTFHGPRGGTPDHVCFAQWDLQYEEELDHIQVTELMYLEIMTLCKVTAIPSVMNSIFLPG